MALRPTHVDTNEQDWHRSQYPTSTRPGTPDRPLTPSRMSTVDHIVEGLYNRNMHGTVIAPIRKHLLSNNELAFRNINELLGKNNIGQLQQYEYNLYRNYAKMWPRIWWWFNNFQQYSPYLIDLVQLHLFDPQHVDFARHVNYGSGRLYLPTTQHYAYLEWKFGQPSPTIRTQQSPSQDIPLLELTPSAIASLLRYAKSIIVYYGETRFVSMRHGSDTTMANPTFEQYCTLIASLAPLQDRPYYAGLETITYQDNVQYICSGVVPRNMNIP